jgi:hypothetical protein
MQDTHLGIRYIGRHEGRFGEFPGSICASSHWQQPSQRWMVERSRDEDAGPDFDSEIADVGKRIKILSDREQAEEITLMATKRGKDGFKSIDG